MNRKEIIVVIILTLVITFMDITGIPSILLFDISIADVEYYVFPLMINFIFISIMLFTVLKFFCPDWNLGLNLTGMWSGIKKYGFAGALAGVLSCFAFCIGLSPFDYKPTIWKILFEGIIYYVGVGIIEELYVRGLFLNTIEKLAYKTENKTMIAIWVSSIVFGLGHIPGMIGMGALVITFKLMSTIGMGLYFGMIYKKTKNLCVPIIMHILIDICALPYCFTTLKGYKTITLVLLVAIYILLGIYSIILMRKREEPKIS